MALNSGSLDDINGQTDPTIPKKNRLGSTTTGAINGVNDPTQSVYAQKPPQSIAALPYTDPNAPAPGAAQPQNPAQPQSNPGVAFGRNLATVGNVVKDALGRAVNTGADIATLPGRYVANVAGNVASGIGGGVGTAFNPTPNSDAYMANNSGPPSPAQNPISAIPDYVVKSMFNPTTADVAAAGALRNPAGSTLPGAAGAMAAAIPAVATGIQPTGFGAMNSSSSSRPLTRDSFSDRAAAAGGVKQADGSYAFSNMPKVAGYNPALNSLGDNTNVASASNMANPGLGTNGYTPTSGQGEGIAALPNFNNAVNDARADNRQSQRDAMSDMASIAGGDWRTPSGTAARNAAIDLKSNLESAGRYAHGRSADALRQAYLQQYQNTVGGMPASVLDGLRGDSSINQDALRGIASLGTASLNNDARVNAAQARADALERGWGYRADAMRDVADTNAGARVGAATISANRPRTSAALDHGATTAYMAAYNDPKNADLPDDQRFAAAQKARAAYLSSNGGASATQRSSPSLDDFMAAARKQNPGVSDSDLQAYYKKKYQQ